MDWIANKPLHSATSFQLANSDSLFLHQRFYQLLASVEQRWLRKGLFDVLALGELCIHKVLRIEYKLQEFAKPWVGAKVEYATSSSTSSKSALIRLFVRHIMTEEVSKLVQNDLKFVWQAQSDSRMW